MNRQLYVTSDRWSLHKEDTFRQIGKTPTIWHTDDTRGLARTAPPSEPGDALVGFPMSRPQPTLETRPLSFPFAKDAHSFTSDAVLPFCS